MNNGMLLIDEIKPGDIVRFKSGGPRMTVGKTDRFTDGLLLTVYWATGNDQGHGMQVTDVAVVKEQ